MTVAYYRDLLRSRFEGRDLVVATGVVASATPLLARLRELGAGRAFVLADSLGTGPLPAADEAEWKIVGGDAADLMSNTRAYEAALGDIPVAASRALDRFDPQGSALVLRAIWLALPEVAGRRVYGARDPPAFRLRRSGQHRGLRLPRSARRPGARHALPRGTALIDPRHRPARRRRRAAADRERDPEACRPEALPLRGLFDALGRACDGPRDNARDRSARR